MWPVTRIFMFYLIENLSPEFVRVTLEFSRGHLRIKSIIYVPFRLPHKAINSFRTATPALEFSKKSPFKEL